MDSIIGCFNLNIIVSNYIKIKGQSHLKIKNIPRKNEMRPKSWTYKIKYVKLKEVHFVCKKQEQ